MNPYLINLAKKYPNSYFTFRAIALSEGYTEKEIKEFIEKRS